MAMHFPALFSPGMIGGCSVKNRIIMPLYPTKYATDSRVNAKMLEFYRARARGGVGLIVLDCPCLDYPRAYKGGQELRIDRPEYCATVRELLQAVHDGGARAFMQLNYPKERTLDHEVPGAKQKGDSWKLPLANTMSAAEADEILTILANGAKSARELGYDGVEIQASYGDLVPQLLSPVLNKRTDQFGGTLGNRARFLLRLIAAVKEVAGHDFPVMIKLVCAEFVEHGLEVAEAAEIAALAAAAGADAIIANGGNKATKFMTIPGHDSPPGPLVALAARIKEAVAVPVIAIAKINTPALAEEIISRGQADFVAMARPLVADPDLPNKAAAGRVEDIRGCVYCLEDCADKGVSGIGRCCLVNPFAGHEHDWPMTPAPTKRKVLVVGGGPAGMQAAIIADQRGHDVELWEQDPELGGQLRLAHLAPFKEEMAEALRYLRHRLAASKVAVRLGTAATAAAIMARDPDAVVAACGSIPACPPIPGLDDPQVFHARQVYASRPPLGRRLVIVGGGDLGCETADWLAGPDREVTVVEILAEVLHRMKKIPRQRLLARLKAKGVSLLTETRVASVAPGAVRIIGKDGRERTLAADNVILAVGAEPEKRLPAGLGNSRVQVLVVGDGAVPGNLGAALRSGTAAALAL
jgi:2,4-dienoyl-CoA reductase-like NADH-dependent reductase (Old Yellow Enzyme family)/thioredoxin reductase